VPCTAWISTGGSIVRTCRGNICTKIIIIIIIIIIITNFTGAITLHIAQIVNIEQLPHYRP